MRVIMTLDLEIELSDIDSLSGTIETCEKS